MKVIFDTNVYRYLYEDFLKGKSEQDAMAYIGTLCNRELFSNKDKKLSFFVLCELIQHLSQADALRIDYFNMTCFALAHANVKGSLKLAVPPEVEIYKEIAGENHSEFLKAMNNIIGLLFDVCVVPQNIENVDKREDDINLVAKVLEDYKQNFIASYQKILSDVYGLPAIERKNKIRAIRNHDSVVYEEIILSLVRYILNFIDKDKVPEQLNSAILYQKYFIGTSVMIHFLKRIINSNGIFNYQKHKNDIIDFLICHSLSLEEDYLFVTGEEKILGLFAEVGLDNKSMHVNLYLKELGLEQVRRIRTF